MNLQPLCVPAYADPFHRGIGRLIALVGTPRFEQALFDAAAEATHCSHLSAFVSASATPPRLVLAANLGEALLARSVGQRYVREYWGLDPANDIVASTRLPEQGAVMRLRSDEIGSAVYRKNCYTGVDLNDRLSLIRRHHGRLYRLNFYCGTETAGFSDTAVARIVDAAEPLLALVMRHAEMIGRDTIAEPPDFASRLLEVHPTMPTREVQVCTGIARGLTSEGIALEHDIAVNTVLTYRRRAYARLGISSQNELLHLLLAASPWRASLRPC